MTIEEIIDQNIKTNNVQAITANVLNFVLKQMLADLRKNNNVVEVSNIVGGVPVNTVSLPLDAKTMVICVAFLPDAALADVKFGTTNGGNEVYEAYDMPANKWTVVQIDHIAAANGVLYISGLTGNVTVRFYKQ